MDRGAEKWALLVEVGEPEVPAAIAIGREMSAIASACTMTLPLARTTAPSVATSTAAAAAASQGSSRRLQPGL